MLENCKAVYFDMGGVLMNVVPEYSRENAINAAVTGPKVARFLGPDFSLEHFLEFMGDSIKLRAEESPGIQEDAWLVDRQMLQDFTGKAVPCDVLKEKFWNQINYMTSCFEPVQGVRETLQYVKDRGYLIGLISNVFHPAIIFKELFTEWGIVDYFKPLLFSSEYRYKKPHRAIFDYALSWHPSLKPEETIFLGDTWDIDVIGAQGAGLIPIWINAEHDEKFRENVRVIKTVTELPSILK